VLEGKGRNAPSEARESWRAPHPLMTYYAYYKNTEGRLFAATQFRLPARGSHLAQQDGSPERGLEIWKFWI
jgi:hypothetical protein